MSISVTSLSNIQIRDVFQDFNEENSLVNSFPKDSIIQVEVINGKKEGKGKVLSRKSILLAELNFKNDNLDGHCFGSLNWWQYDMKMKKSHNSR